MLEYWLAVLYCRRIVVDDGVARSGPYCSIPSHLAAATSDYRCIAYRQAEAALGPRKYGSAAVPCSTISCSIILWTAWQLRHATPRHATQRNASLRYTTLQLRGVADCIASTSTSTSTSPPICLHLHLNLHPSGHHKLTSAKQESVSVSMNMNMRLVCCLSV
jgi:hypothetical protein